MLASHLDLMNDGRLDFRCFFLSSHPRLVGNLFEALEVPRVYPQRRQVPAQGRLVESVLNKRMRFHPVGRTVERILPRAVTPHCAQPSERPVLIDRGRKAWVWCERFEN